MSTHVRRSLTVLLAACLVIAATGAASAQTEIEGGSPAPDATRTPGLAEVALCQMPELGEPAGRVGPRIASASGVAGRRAGRTVPIVNADTFDPEFGCTFPVGEAMEPFTGEMRDGVLFGDVGLPGIVRDVRVFHLDLSRGDLRRITRQRGVETLGRLRPGSHVVVVVGHDRIPDDVGLNLFTDLDGRPFNDAPLAPNTPDLPLGGVQGGYSVFGDRLFITDFTDGGEYYTGDPGEYPFAATGSQGETAFLIPRDGVGTTITPFVFADGSSHYIDVLPNGALPVDGRVPLWPECLSQEVRHQPLVLVDAPISASTDWVSACFPMSLNAMAVIRPFFDGSDSRRVPITFTSWDPGASEGTTAGARRPDLDSTPTTSTCCSRAACSNTATTRSTTWASQGRATRPWTAFSRAWRGRCSPTSCRSR